MALAFCAAGSKADQAAIEDVLARGGDFAPAWLRHKGLDWAADLIPGTEEGSVPCAAE